MDYGECLNYDDLNEDVQDSICEIFDAIKFDDGLAVVVQQAAIRAQTNSLKLKLQKLRDFFS